MIQLKQTNVLKGTATRLPASKSIANRALIINALAGGDAELHNLSDANDTQLMLRLVNSKDAIIDVEDAGTTMRFLTAFFSATNQSKILTGTSRMKERPIGILVNALRALGVVINYPEKDGYPPIEIVKFEGQKTNHINIRGDISSQFISALMMIAPALPQGLTLELEGKIGSRPYIEMTASIMRHFGASVDFTGNKVTVPHQAYKSAPFTVESDWSAASYWFAFTALAKEAEILLPRLSLNSLQGDSVVVQIMDQLGVQAKMENGMLKLTKKAHASEITWDFTHCPDLAQTIAVVCVAKGIKGNFTGLESLRIKETDRIAALQNELKKIGGELIEIDTEHWTLIPSKQLPTHASFATYKDHRMAMAFAPLVTLMDVAVDKGDVVRKSYPNYWNDLKSFQIPLTES
ncbi:3-phosphoshikimate 1-carboxyvinyltransferase [Pseudochryseolinea flava]|uniref:3-phosphoshikimate 1-carboxyvinyltransferase n=1 Tax=Pseudochryseolinea flava TaxID=2059302 RepID=A0A364XTI7_9BACT|nr:3-phosphoshikimate 1-carboxyvinyltransferase [Pseudochryseolinea flava]RAV97669.1 3-phosphoshikimate 1-carboxyvinyltransferase [Pseudochryseolinea flava]